MKKTLLSILALSAGVAFAQNFTPMKFAKDDALKAKDTTMLMFQGPDCTNEVLLPGIFANTIGADTVFEAVQKFTYTTNAKVIGGGVMIGSKKVGAVGGTTTYTLKVYDNNNGNVGALLGESNPVSFNDLIGPSNDSVFITPFIFATPVAVQSTFFVSFTVNDGVAGTDTVRVIEAYPFSGSGPTITNVSELAGDCAGSTAFIGNQTITYLPISTASQIPPPNGFGVKLDPKLGIAVALEFEDEISVVNNETISYSIFPNPTSDVLNVQYTLTKEGTVTMNVVDLTGRVVRNIVKENQGAFQATEQINIAGLNAGIYLLNVTANGNTTTQKFIVK